MSQESQPSQSCDYFAARAAEERRLAMAASDPRARAIHLDMANKYAELSQVRDSSEPIGEAGQRQRTG